MKQSLADTGIRGHCPVRGAGPGTESVKSCDAAGIGAVALTADGVTPIITGVSTGKARRGRLLPGEGAGAAGHQHLGGPAHGRRMERTLAIRGWWRLRRRRQCARIAA